MIRRDIQLPDKKPSWLLISQIEHARISGLLAKECIDKFAQSTGSLDLTEVRQELLAAIIHHDDGWKEWEADPELDQFGRPPSFRELPIDESLKIWSASIRTAETIGSLAAWTVAGHFAALLEASESVSEEVACVWLREVAAQRSNWLSNWKATRSSKHTEDIACEALRWLQLYDVMSLWLCSVCPGGGELNPVWPELFQLNQDLSISAGRIENDDPAPMDTERTQVMIEPWPFIEREIPVDAAGIVVPVQEYSNIQNLLREKTPHQLRWLLVPKS